MYVVLPIHVLRRVLWAEVTKMNNSHFSPWLFHRRLVYLYYKQRNIVLDLPITSMLSSFFVVSRGTANCVIAVPRSCFLADLRSCRSAFFFACVENFSTALDFRKCHVIIQLLSTVHIVFVISWNRVRIPASRSLWCLRDRLSQIHGQT